MSEILGDGGGGGVEGEQIFYLMMCLISLLPKISISQFKANEYETKIFILGAVVDNVGDINHRHPVLVS